MSDQRENMRIGLRFKDDEDSKKAYEYLKSLGRNKSEYITQLILADIECKKKSNVYEVDDILEALKLFDKKKKKRTRKNISTDDTIPNINDDTELDSINIEETTIEDDFIPDGVNYNEKDAAKRLNSLCSLGFSF